LGEAQYRAGKPGEASETLAKSIKAHPESQSRDRAEFFLALCRMADDKHKEAAAGLESLRRRDPKGPLAAQAALLEGQCRQRLGEKDAALKLYGLAAESGDASVAPDALLGTAQIARASGDAAGAERALKTVFDRFGDSPASPLAKLEL